MRQGFDVEQMQAEAEAVLRLSEAVATAPQTEIGAAAANLVRTGPAGVAAACRLLGHRRLAVREAAVLALVEVGEPTVGAVAPFVQAKRILEVEAAVRVLLEIGTPAAIAALLDAIINGSRRMQRRMRLRNSVTLAFGCVTWLVWAASWIWPALGAVLGLGTGYAACVQVIAVVLNGYYNSLARRLVKVWSNATVQGISDGRMTALMSELVLTGGLLPTATYEGLAARLTTVTPADAVHFTHAACVP